MTTTTSRPATATRTRRYSTNVERAARRLRRVGRLHRLDHRCRPAGGRVLRHRPRLVGVLRGRVRRRARRPHRPARRLVGPRRAPAAPARRLVLVYPAWFVPELQTPVGWIENDGYVALLALALYLVVQRLRRVTLTASALPVTPVAAAGAAPAGTRGAAPPRAARRPGSRSCRRRTSTRGMTPQPAPEPRQRSAPRRGERGCGGGRARGARAGGAVRLVWDVNAWDDYLYRQQKDRTKVTRINDSSSPSCASRSPGSASRNP